MRPHLIHTSPLQVGHVAACVSFSQMAVSFTHIIKASEPVLSVALSGPLLGVNYPLYVWLSLLPIVAGCSMSAMKEVSFVWAGEQQGGLARGSDSDGCVRSIRFTLLRAVHFISLRCCCQASTTP